MRSTLPVYLIAGVMQPTRGKPAGKGGKSPMNDSDSSSDDEIQHVHVGPDITVPVRDPESSPEKDKKSRFKRGKQILDKKVLPPTYRGAACTMTAGVITFLMGIVMLALVKDAWPDKTLRLFSLIGGLFFFIIGTVLIILSIVRFRKKYLIQKKKKADKEMKEKRKRDGDDWPTSFETSNEAEKAPKLIRVASQVGMELSHNVGWNVSQVKEADDNSANVFKESGVVNQAYGEPVHYLSKGDSRGGKPQLQEPLSPRDVSARVGSSYNLQKDQGSNASRLNSRRGSLQPVKQDSLTSVEDQPAKSAHAPGTMGKSQSMANFGKVAMNPNRLEPITSNSKVDPLSDIPSEEDLLAKRRWGRRTQSVGNSLMALEGAQAGGTPKADFNIFTISESAA